MSESLAVSMPVSLVRRARPSQVVGVALLAALAAALWYFSADQALSTRACLLVMLAALALWATQAVDELWVGLGACLAMMAFGAIGPQALQKALGSELIWLMLGAFMMAAALQQSGAAGALCARLLGHQPTFGSLLVRLHLAITLSAFLIPSTSARAALFLPVFMALLPGLQRLGSSAVRVVALLIPSQILLTAGLSLTGAGAHLVAVQFLDTHAGLQIGALQWTLLALPVVLLTSLAASASTLSLLGGWSLCRVRMSLDAQDTAAAPFTSPQRRVIAIAGLVALGWMVAPLWGMPSWCVGLIGAVAVGTRAICGLSIDALVRAVDWPLLLFFAATVVLGEAMVHSGAAEWIAQLALAGHGPERLQANIVILSVALISLLAHLWIPSRTARVIVLLPALVLALASDGQQLAVLTLVCVQASGFCQSFASSAKPMAVFSRIRVNEAPVLQAGDLLRAAWPVGIAMAVTVSAVAILWWPRMVGINP